MNRKVPRSQENGYRVMMVLGMGEPKRPKLSMGHEPTPRVDVENKGDSNHGHGAKVTKGMMGFLSK